ncbi:MAG: ribose-phosphate pyrophosphokinase [Candidatus Sericytochromatia bacterium]|nr:ribose-phosphate pyrophosphokinase [Candidatus Sericytochromatia bacterium]
MSTAAQVELPDNLVVRRDIKLFSGSASPALAQEIAEYLGVELGGMKIANFSDGEIYVQIQESVRGDDVFIVQPVCHPVNYHLMELLIMLDAFKRASARQVTAVVPYYAYARQDRKAHGREAISAKLVADLLTTAGADRVLAMDLHTPQIQGFFDILVDHLFATPVLVDYLTSKKLVDPVVVSPDVGGVARARAFAKKLDCPIAIIDKRRIAHNQAEVMHVIGEVKGRTAIMVDDMVDTAGTLVAGAALLAREGASAVYAACTHGILSGPAIERIRSSNLVELIVTNTIVLAPEKRLPNIIQLSVAPLLGEAMMRIHEDTSVSTLFD